MGENKERSVSVSPGTAIAVLSERPSPMAGTGSNVNPEGVLLYQFVRKIAFADGTERRPEDAK